MRKTLLTIVAVATLAVASSGAQAQMSERQTTGAVIGAGTGLVVAGPVGAVVGGVVGAAVRGSRAAPGNRAGTTGAAIGTAAGGDCRALSLFS